MRRVEVDRPHSFGCIFNAGVLLIGDFGFWVEGDLVVESAVLWD